MARRFLLVAAWLCMWHVAASPAAAQYFAGLFSDSPPLFSLSDPRAEMRLRPSYLSISGKQVIPALGVAWDLREQFGFDRGRLLLDLMIRVQAGRFSFRMHWDNREFKATRPFLNQPGQFPADARFEYSGCRLGGDFDILLSRESRLGINVDGDLYQPFFSESILTTGGGKRFFSTSPVTIGAHIVVQPARPFYGVFGIVEARARWGIIGPDFTDWEIAAGIKSWDTVLGSIALRGGYRDTAIGIKATQLVNSLPYSTKLDVNVNGWFAELVYYY